MTEAPRTRLELEDGIAWITLDDGKVNAMSTAMLREIGERLDAAEAARAVAVLRGREGIFSAGFDLATLRGGAEAAIEMVRTGALLVERLLAFPYPVLTVCTGHAYPMGAFLMLAADARLGVSGPWRIGLNEVAIGLTLPRFAVALARHRLTAAGYVRTPSAALFPPEDAMRLGYLDCVVAPEALDPAVRAEATRLRALDMHHFAATKTRVNADALSAVRDGLQTDLGEAGRAA